MAGAYAGEMKKEGAMMKQDGRQKGAMDKEDAMGKDEMTK